MDANIIEKDRLNLESNKINSLVADNYPNSAENGSPAEQSLVETTQNGEESPPTKEAKSDVIQEGMDTENGASAHSQEVDSLEPGEIAGSPDGTQFKLEDGDGEEQYGKRQRMENGIIGHQEDVEVDAFPETEEAGTSDSWLRARKESKLKRKRPMDFKKRKSSSPGPSDSMSPTAPSGDNIDADYRLALALQAEEDRQAALEDHDNRYSPSLQSTSQMGRFAAPYPLEENIEDQENSLALQRPMEYAEFLFRRCTQKKAEVFVPTPMSISGFTIHYYIKGYLDVLNGRPFPLPMQGLVLPSSTPQDQKTLTVTTAYRVVSSQDAEGASSAPKPKKPLVRVMNVKRLFGDDPSEQGSSSSQGSSSVKQEEEEEARLGADTESLNPGARDLLKIEVPEASNELTIYSDDFNHSSDSVFRAPNIYNRTYEDEQDELRQVLELSKREYIESQQAKAGSSSGASASSSYAHSMSPPRHSSPVSDFRDWYESGPSTSSSRKRSSTSRASSSRAGPSTSSGYNEGASTSSYSGPSTSSYSGPSTSSYSGPSTSSGWNEGASTSSAYYGPSTSASWDDGPSTSAGPSTPSKPSGRQSRRRHRRPLGSIAPEDDDQFGEETFYEIDEPDVSSSVTTEADKKLPEFLWLDPESMSLPEFIEPEELERMPQEYIEAIREEHAMGENCPMYTGTPLEQEYMSMVRSYITAPTIVPSTIWNTRFEVYARFPFLQRPLYVTNVLAALRFPDNGGDILPKMHPFIRSMTVPQFFKHAVNIWLGLRFTDQPTDRVISSDEICEAREASFNYMRTVIDISDPLYSTIPEALRSNVIMDIDKAVMEAFRDQIIEEKKNAVLRKFQRHPRVRKVIHSYSSTDARRPRRRSPIERPLPVTFLPNYGGPLPGPEADVPEGAAAFPENVAGPAPPAAQYHDDEYSPQSPDPLVGSPSSSEGGEVIIPHERVIEFKCDVPMDSKQVAVAVGGHEGNPQKSVKEEVAEVSEEQAPEEVVDASDNSVEEEVVETAEEAMGTAQPSDAPTQKEVAELSRDPVDKTSLEHGVEESKAAQSAEDAQPMEDVQPTEDAHLSLADSQPDSRSGSEPTSEDQSIFGLTSGVQPVSEPTSEVQTGAELTSENLSSLEPTSVVQSAMEPASDVQLVTEPTSEDQSAVEPTSVVQSVSEPTSADRSALEPTSEVKV